MNTKIETFLTYMLVLFLTIAFESSLRATEETQGLDLTFSGAIESKQITSAAIKITDLSDHELPSIIWHNVNTYKSGTDNLTVDPHYVEIKVKITGTAGNSGLTVEVQHFKIAGSGLKNFPGLEDLVTSSKMGSGTSTFAWNTAWSLLVTTKDGTEEKLSETTKKKSTALHPDTTGGKIYHIKLHPMLQFPISEQEDAGGQINGVVRLNFSADLTA